MKHPRCCEPADDTGSAIRLYAGASARDMGRVIRDMRAAGDARADEAERIRMEWVRLFGRSK